MKSLCVIVAGLILSWVLTDVRSESGFFNLFMPLCAGLFGIALLIWLVFALAVRRTSGAQPTAYDMLDSHHQGGDGGSGGE